MSTMTDNLGRVMEPQVSSDRNFAAMFAEMQKWQKAYDSASPEIRDIVDTMVQIINDPGADDDERQAAIDTMDEALFPTFTNGVYGIPIEDTAVDADGNPIDDVETREKEKVFARKVKAAMKRRGMTQTQLAQRIGIGQPAVSMLLRRVCRPQKATVNRIAKALDLDPNDLWPE